MQTRSLGLAALVLGCLATAQTPFDYLLVSEQSATGADALHYVHPRTGHAARVVPANNNWTRPSLTTIALDPTDPLTLYGIGGLSTSIAQQIKIFGVQNEELQSQLQVTINGAARVKRASVFQNTLVYTATGSQAGLYQVPLQGGLATLLAPLADPVDVAILGSKAYANSYTSGQSTILEHDLVAGTTRTLGTYGGIRCLAVLGGALVAGTDVGDLVGIDPVTGQSGLLLPTGKPNHVAVGVVLGSLIVFATSLDVWSVANPSTPLYTAQGAITDLEIGVHDRASFFRYGKGCTGTGAQGPVFQYVNLPSIGNANFTLAVRGGRPSSPAVLLVGLSRTRFGATTLPFKLDSVGMPGCELLVAPVADGTVGLDPLGAGSFVLPVPATGLPKGAELNSQWFVLDAGANPLGVSASEGAVAIVR
jgi:hypothetical protein